MNQSSLRPGVTTVTPTRRLAHWLKRRFDDSNLEQGLEVWRTPDIVTWPGLVERLFSEERQAGRIQARWLPDSAARLIWERMVRRDPAAAALVAPGLLGRAAHESWRRMHAYEIPARVLDTEDRPEAVAFVRWVREYTDWLDTNGWLDEASATGRLGCVAPGAHFEFAGFDVLTPAQRSLLGRLEQSGAIVTHRPPEERGGSVAWVECQDRRTEFDTAARWAAARLDREPGARLAVVVPDLFTVREEARRSIERVLVPAAAMTRGPAPESRGFELAAARGLSAQPLVAAALELIEAFSGAMDFPAASRLLLNPFLGMPPGEADSRARLDAHVRRNEGPDPGVARLVRLAGDKHCPGLERSLASGLALQQDWPRRALPSRWSQLWFQLLGALGWPGGDLDGDEHQAHQRWGRLLAEVGAHDDCTGTLTVAEAAALLRDQADGVLFEPQELRAALTIIDPDTCAGMSFDALWVCGLDAGRWPAPAAPDPFIPREWQQRKDLPGATAEIAAVEARRLLARLCRSADEVILSVPQFEGEAPLLQSALLAGIPRARAQNLWDAPAPAAAIFAARPALEQRVDGTMPAVTPEESTRGGAKLLEVQSACPFRAQAEFRLGARALEDPELGVAASERGELVHEVLARVWRELGGQLALRELAVDELRAAVRGAIEVETAAVLRSGQGFMRHLIEIEAGWLESRVVELLAKDLERPPFTVESIEQDHVIGLGGLTLTLRVDRIDRLPDGSCAVIDYKTGADAETDAWFGERPRLPQLPLYALAVGPDRVSAVAFGRIRAGDTGYCGIARDAGTLAGLTNPGTRAWPKEHPSWEELIQAWRRRLTALASEHAAGDARLAPDPTHACRYCQLGMLCRIGEARLGITAGEPGDE